MSDVMTHLQYWTKQQPSPLGLKVAELLDVWDGLHHFDEAQMKKVEWHNPHHLKLQLSDELATFDGAQMTRLVFLAHDHSVRVSVRACNPRYLTLLFHNRNREGSLMERHPTLEQAVSDWRKYHPLEVPAQPNFPELVKS